MLTAFGWVEARPVVSGRDIRLVVPLLRQAYPDENWSETAVRMFLNRPGRMAAAAMAEDLSAVGCVLFRRPDKPRQGLPEIEIARLVVRDDCRRQRIGSYLVQCVRRGLARSLLQPDTRPVAFVGRIRADDAVAIGFARACGFVEDVRLPAYYPGGQDAVQVILLQEPGLIVRPAAAGRVP